MTECTHCRKRYDDSVRFCPVDGFAVAPVAEPWVGRLLMGQFLLKAVCGHGATGTVYQAVQAGMERAVAVKVLRADLLKDPDVVRRFVREARAGAKLSHQNIATVHLVGQTDEGEPFLVMEYVEGLALAAVLTIGKPLPLSRITHIGTQIASALSEAHSQGIVHRDLKPENILLTERRGESDVVKVVDFGIAKMVAHAAPGEDPISRLGTVFGTPHYIAPEQASGQTVDGRADIYSLGCILYQMATGHVPFEGQAGLQVLLSQVRDPVPDPRQLNPRLGDALAELILHMLAKDPAERPQTAEEVSRLLQLPPSGRAAEGRPGSGRAAEARPTSGRAAEARPASGRAAEARPASGRAVEARPTSGRAAEARPTSGRVPEPEPVEDEPESASSSEPELAPEIAPEHAAFFGPDVRTPPPRSGRDPSRRASGSGGSSRERASGRRGKNERGGRPDGRDAEARRARHEEADERTSQADSADRLDREERTERADRMERADRSERVDRSERALREERTERVRGRAARRHAYADREDSRDTPVPFLRRYWLPLVGVGGAVTFGLLAGLLYAQWASHPPPPPVTTPVVQAPPPAMPTRSSGGSRSTPLIKPAAAPAAAKPSSPRLPEVVFPAGPALTGPQIVQPPTLVPALPTGTLPGPLPMMAPPPATPSQPAPVAAPTPTATTSTPSPAAPVAPPPRPAAEPTPPATSSPPASAPAEKPPAVEKPAATEKPAAEKPAATEKPAAAEKPTPPPEEADEPSSDPYHRLK